MNELWDNIIWDSFFLPMRTWVCHLWLRIYMADHISALFVLSYGYDGFRMTTRPSRGIRLAVEGGCIVVGNFTILRQTQASSGWIYSTALQFTPAGPPLNINETSTCMTDWDVTEVASCLDKVVLFTLGGCQTAADLIPPPCPPGSLGPSHSVLLINGLTNYIWN